MNFPNFHQNEDRRCPQPHLWAVPVHQSKGYKPSQPHHHSILTVLELPINEITICTQHHVYAFNLLKLLFWITFVKRWLTRWKPGILRSCSWYLLGFSKMRNLLTRPGVTKGRGRGYSLEAASWGRGLGLGAWLRPQLPGGSWRRGRGGAGISGLRLRNSRLTPEVQALRELSPGTAAAAAQSRWWSRRGEFVAGPCRMLGLGLERSRGRASGILGIPYPRPLRRSRRFCCPRGLEPFPPPSFQARSPEPGVVGSRLHPRLTLDEPLFPSPAPGASVS
jgi:hypothetical protein